MELAQRLEALDPHIRAVARRFASSIPQINDAEQDARLAIWELLQEYPDSADAVLLESAAEAIVAQRKKVHWQNEYAKKKFVSLSEPSPSTEVPLEERIGFTPVFTTRKERRDNFYLAVRSHGRAYVTALRKQARPKDAVREVIRYAVEEVAEFSKEEIPKKADYSFFVEVGLQSLLWQIYRNSPMSAIMDAYPGEFKPWQGNRVPNGFWHGRHGQEHVMQALQWFAVKHKLNTAADCARITDKEFEKDGLSTVLNTKFNGSTHLALKTLFPDLKPWQSRRTRSGYLSYEPNRREALTSYLMAHGCPSIRELEPEDVYELGLRRFVTTKSLCDYGLRGLLEYHGKSVYRALKYFFPHQILPWTLANTKEVWERNPRRTAGHAVRWLFDWYLEIPEEQIPLYATDRLFWQVGFSGILTNRRIDFNSSVYDAVNNAYPRRFARSDFRRWRPTIVIGGVNMRKEYGSASAPPGSSSVPARSVS